MCHRFFTLCPLLPGLALLGACSSYAPPDGLAGMNRQQVVARMGQPETQRQWASGSRLEFAHGPFGKQTWFVYFDGAGRASRAEQVLTEQNFNRINAGMTQEAVRELLGAPGEVHLLGRARGMVWSYRYVNTSCNWFQIELSLERQVRSAGYGEPPECEAPNDRPAR